MFSPAPDRAAHRPLLATLREAALTVVAFVTLDDGRASTGIEPVLGGAHDRPHRRGQVAPAADDQLPRASRRRFERTPSALALRAGHPHHHPLGGPDTHRRPATSLPRPAVCTSPVASRPTAAPLRPARLVWTRAATPAAGATCRTPRTAA